MRPSSERINIAASARRLDVDNRISLRYYFRIADNILKQADIFRAEKNVIDLYIMLLRFSSLVSETIPCHRDYGVSLQSNKVYLKKRLFNAVNELEALKPVVQEKINEIDRKYIYQVKDSGNSLEWPPVRKQTLINYDVIKTVKPVTQGFLSQGSRFSQNSPARPVELQFNRLRPKDETLSRHSILGPNGLRGQWQPSRSNVVIQYPSNIDLTPVDIPSLQHSIEEALTIQKDEMRTEHDKSSLESSLTASFDSSTVLSREAHPMISFETTEDPVQTDIIRQPSPPPVLAEVHDLIPATSLQVNEPTCGIEKPSVDSFVSEDPLQLHISTTLMENFMRLAKSNTNENLETCGVLAGSLKNRKFYVTALIIPKQESTPNSCQTTNEEEIFEVQDKQSLFPLGWIHTHPTQSCFMSSIDVHTQYSYQIMLPESVAIVMAPRDDSKNHGIFRLTNPGGMSVIRQCQQRGFHPHNPPPDGGPIYKSCTDVYMNPSLKLDVIDLR